jgi:urease accessory protein
MQLADPLAQAWKAELRLRFAAEGGRTVLRERRSDGPLVVQKPLYPEGESICHAIVVHPPGGIAGGDQLSLDARCESSAHALLTTPGAGKWYRSAGAWAGQRLSFDVEGTMEWLPRETIVFDGALCSLQSAINLGEAASFIGWEVVCLGRGEGFRRGRLRMETRVRRGKKLLHVEQGEIEGGGRLLDSPVGLGGRGVFGTLIATSDAKMPAMDKIATTHVSGLLIARYLGDSSEEALAGFSWIWRALRPGAVEPRIWAT